MGEGVKWAVKHESLWSHLWSILVGIGKGVSGEKGPCQKGPVSRIVYFLSSLRAQTATTLICTKGGVSADPKRAPESVEFAHFLRAFYAKSAQILHFLALFLGSAETPLFVQINVFAVWALTHIWKLWRCWKHHSTRNYFRNERPNFVPRVCKRWFPNGGSSFSPESKFSTPFKPQSYLCFTSSFPLFNLFITST